MRDKIKEALHIEKHEAVRDLCGGLIALTKRELEGRARGYVVIINGRIVRVMDRLKRMGFRIPAGDPR